MTHGSKCLLLEITFCYLLYLITSLLCDGNQIKQIYTPGHIFVVRKKNVRERGLISPLTPENNCSSSKWKWILLLLLVITRVFNGHGWISWD